MVGGDVVGSWLLRNEADQSGERVVGGPRQVLVKVGAKCRAHVDRLGRARGAGEALEIAIDLVLDVDLLAPHM